jgi:hypothetical protein
VKTDIMAELLAKALACNMTRVFSFMLTSPATTHVFGNLGVPNDMHATCHAGDWQRVKDITLYQMQAFAGFLAKLQATSDPFGASLLDRSLVFGVSEYGEGWQHSVNEMPCVMVGAAMEAQQGRARPRCRRKLQQGPRDHAAGARHHDADVRLERRADERARDGYPRVAIPRMRRALLGVELPRDGEAFTPEGMRVAGVVAGSMAQAAGVLPGDCCFGWDHGRFDRRSSSERLCAARVRSTLWRSSSRGEALRSRSPRGSSGDRREIAGRRSGTTNRVEGRAPPRDRDAS